MPQVNVWVDVDLDEFDTQDLKDELETRGTKFEDTGNQREALQGMFQALALGDDAKALALLRAYLCDCLGRVLA